MEKNVQVSILCQIYGKLLTKKQYEILTDYYNHDLSLSEIAENNQITRQAVRDIIKKGENKLFELEEKLSFMEKTMKQEKLLQDPRWKYGIPPKGNANYAWLQHMIDKLSMKGKAAIILANGALSSDTSGEGEIRKKIIENDLVDCIISMPTNLFYTVTVPCSIWIINRNKKQKGYTLFINASNMGTMVTRKLRELSKEDILKIADTYHNYQNDTNYEDEPGYCKKATLEEIKSNNYVLTPGRYVGIEEKENDDIPFEEKMIKLTQELSKQFEESHKLEEEIKKNLGVIGYDM